MKTRLLVGIGVAAFAASAVTFYYQEAYPGVFKEPRPGASPGRESRLAGDREAVRGLTLAVERLEAELKDQRVRQQELGGALARLQRQIEPSEAFKAEGVGPGSDLTGPPDLAPAAAQSLDAALAGVNASASPERREQQRAQLISAGFSPTETDEIFRAVDENTLQRLRLRYQAARGGDAARDSREEMRSLPSNRELVRDQFGERAYDQYLYATGRPNRVVVQGVLEGSPAQQVGLRSGDTLLEFDDQPIYAVGDLMRISAAGREYDSVPLSVLRDEQIIQVSVPRGPLGINASPDSVNPARLPEG